MASARDGVRVERLDHLGLVAGICREIGLAEYLDAQDAGSHERVSVGTATVAMVLNGLGFSNRRLYLVPQFFATKPVALLLGAGVAAEDLNDDCLGRALDWLYAHDPTTLFAGIAAQARRRFGVVARQLHVDTTSFAVSGAYARAEAGSGAPGGLDAQTIAITYGYSRDHREDLKQWMLALATTGEGAIPVFLRPLDGNASDQHSLAQAMETLLVQLQVGGEDPGLYVADSGVYGEANMRHFAAVGLRWVSRAPETSREAKALVREEPAAWEANADGTLHWFSRELDLPQGRERWLVVRTAASEARARATLERQAERDRQAWERHLWHLAHREFACQADAQVELTRQLKTLPAWLAVQQTLTARPHYAGRGRPRPDVAPLRTTWQVQATVHVDPAALTHEAARRARFVLATNVLEASALPDEAVITTYKAQNGTVERGFAFLKDPLFLASSVFLKKPERIMALSLIMVLCLLVYRLAEWRLRQQLVVTGQTVPTQLRQPTARPTLRWIFECFEGIDLVTIRGPGGGPGGEQRLLVGLQPLHTLVVSLLGRFCQDIYGATN